MGELSHGHCRCSFGSIHSKLVPRYFKVGGPWGSLDVSAEVIDILSSQDENIQAMAHNTLVSMTAGAVVLALAGLLVFF